MTTTRLLPKTERLSFGKGDDNSKLAQNADSGKSITFSLSAGKSCPGANKCFAYVDSAGVLHAKHKGDDEYICFAANMEKLRANVRKSRERNFRLLRQAKTREAMVALLEGSHTFAGVKRCRVHVGGDLFNENYFLAWCQVAANHPGITFYAYTKSLDIWVNRRLSVPPNFILTASKGGQHDHLIGEHKLKYAEVVFAEKQATMLGLEIDHDDSHAWKDQKPFALLIHSPQQKGSAAAKALAELNRRKRAKGQELPDKLN